MNTESNFPPPNEAEDLARLDTLATLLDNRFRIPGTEIRFGLDALIGLVPYVGDLASFVISGILFSVVLKRGVGLFTLLRMMGNFVLDALVGAIPFLGDLFDFGYKANRRNVDLLKKYYAEEGPKPKASTTIMLLVLLFLLFFAGLIWATGWLLATAWHWVFG